MSFDFTVREFILGNGTGTPTFQFYKQGFVLVNGGTTPSWQDIILSGNTALTLVNAKENGLNYVKLFGKCEQGGGLPEGYTQLEYIQSTGDQYIDTGIYPQDNLTINVTVQCSNQYDIDDMGVVFGFDNRYFGTCLYFSGGAYGFANKAFKSPSPAPYDVNTFEYSISGSSGSYVASLKWEEQTLTHNATRAWGYTFTLFKGNAASDAGNMWNGRYYGASIMVNNNLVRDLIPAKRNSDNELGMYDTVTGDFLPNLGTGSFLAGSEITPTPTPDNPIDIVCNNGVLKVQTNLFNKNKVVEGYAIIASGELDANSSFGYTDLIPVEQAEYAVNNLTVGTTNWTLRIHGCSSNGTWVAQVKEIFISNVVTQVNFSVNNTNIKYVRLSLGIIGRQNLDILQLYPTERPIGSIYTDGTQEVVTDSLGNTANAERLLAVGTYKDEQEVLTGSVTRNVGIKVLDGTEDWSLYPQPNAYRISWAGATATLGAIRYSGLFCTHFEDGGSTSTQAPNKIFFANDLNINFPMTSDFDTIGKCLQYLADQYANGTPVIIVYPLAEPTTETVTPQPLTIQAGTNIITAEGSIDNLELEVSYKGKEE